MHKIKLAVCVATLAFFVLASSARAQTFDSQNYNFWAQGGLTIPSERKIIPLVDRPQLLRWIQSGRALVFLDIREPYEFSGEHLPRAQNISYREISSRHSEIPKGAIVIPYCKMDFRAYVAGRRLIDLGYPHVFLMHPRGLHGWQDDGLPTAGEEVQLSEDHAWRSMLEMKADNLPHEELSTAPADVPPSGEVRKINLVARNLFFEPGEIRANLGDRIIIALEQVGHGHGLVIPAFDIYLDALPEGRFTTIEFIASKAGQFYFACPICCTKKVKCRQGRLVIEKH